MQFCTLVSVALAAAGSAVVASSTGYGPWYISSIRETRPPSNSYQSISFTAKLASQANSTICSNSQDRETGVETCTCDDSAYSCELSNYHGTIALTEKLYQTGAIAVLKGSGDLTLSCQMTAVGGSSCTAPDFAIEVNSTETELPEKFMA